MFVLSRSFSRASKLGWTTSIQSKSFSSCKENPLKALIVGCGVAGNAAALRLASLGVNVTMLTSAKNPHDCNSFWAQGGIIYKGHNDSAALLSSDIHEAGAGISYDPAVKKLAREGPSVVEELLISTSNVPFQRDGDGELSLTLEACHNRARIIYKADHTGKTITTSMIQAVNKNPNISLITDVTVFELAMNSQNECVGVFAMNNEKKSVQLFSSEMTLLATGGVGGIFQNTSNPLAARGDGISLASRAGAKFQNMQYVQFHPTTLYVPNEQRFLLTEALRGEGGILIDPNGRPFAADYHRLKELAPRDIVARMILSEIERFQSQNTELDVPCMYLDITHKDSDWLKSRFPTIYEHCLKHGIDMTKEPLPVIPAAHYHCGGIKVDLNGRTSIRGLYGAGEVACTGLHGANRLASTSLLEGIVWGSAVAEDFVNCQSGMIKDLTPILPSHSGSNAADYIAVERMMSELRSEMWTSFGPKRTLSGMDQGLNVVRQIAYDAKKLYDSSLITPETISLRNAVTAAEEIAISCAGSTESIGTHYIQRSVEDDAEVATSA